MSTADNTDLAATAVQMLIGAGERITMLARHVDGAEFGLQLEDLAYSIDNRLELRCLLPLPGLNRNRDGTLFRTHDAQEPQLEELKAALATLADAGWQTRLVPDAPLTSSLTVDSDAVIHYEYLNDPPGPFYSNSGEQVRHYSDQFDVAWDQSYHPDHTETLYDESLALGRAADSTEIAVASHAAWLGLIDRLARNPDQLRELPPRKFEELIAELLIRDGMEVQLTPETRDGGRDILAFHETPIGRLLYLIECKRHQPSNPVGIAIVQRLYGVLSQERASAGLVVTTSRFSKAALTFADSVSHQLQLKDYEAVKVWLAKHKTA